MTRALLVLLLFGTSIAAAAPAQIPILGTDARPATPRPELRRGLKGRFLHITDMHPDRYYRKGTSESSACHRKQPKKEKPRAGYYGLPFSEECDSSLRFTNFTFDYLDKHWAKEIDFVIWTGDSVRHDNDREIPRLPSEIYELNRATTARMNEIFTERGIPVVPSIGNNDVWPHNIMTAGPNSITNEFSDIWRTFIPFESYQVFQRGGYFSVEVIPDELAVISLNTMYFYDSNKAVGGCGYSDAEDPGNLQLDWLEVQLDRYRDRGMQVWISGHVPPSPGNFFPGCFVRYTETALRFQDTILGQLFGHMNVDHFFYLHTDDLILPTSRAYHTKDDGAEVESNENLADTLIEDFGQLPKPAKTDLDEYAVVNVSPSVVPNPYLPSFRVFSYNITDADGLAGADGQLTESRWKKKMKAMKRDHGHRHPDKSKTKVDCKKKEHKNTWECRPKKPYHAHPESPSRTNQLWTPLGYAQYWLPDLGLANKTSRPKFKLEYLTYSLPSLRAGTGGDMAGQEEAKTGGGGMQYPVPLIELPRSLQDGKVEKSKYAPYEMEDLTIGSWIELGRQLGSSKSKKLRKQFTKYMFMGAVED